MGTFTLAPYYLDDYSGFTRQQKNSINGLLKSFYNRLQSKSVQKTVSSNDSTVSITKQNNTIRLARVSCSKDVIHCYFEFYIGHLQPNAKETFVVFDKMPFDDYYILPSGYVDDTLALPIRNFASFKLEGTSLVIERTEWNPEYLDPYEWYFENKGLENTARIIVDIVRKDSSSSEEGGETSVSKSNNSFVSHGEIKQKVALNTAINTLFSYINSYKADVTKQDYIDINAEVNLDNKYATKSIIGLVGDYVVNIGTADTSGHIVIDSALKEGLVIPTNSYRYGKTVLDEIVPDNQGGKVYDDFDKDMGTEERVTTIELDTISYTITETVHKYERYEGWQPYLPGRTTGYNFSCPFERVEKTVIRAEEIIPIGKLTTN